MKRFKTMLSSTLALALSVTLLGSVFADSATVSKELNELKTKRQAIVEQINSEDDYEKLQELQASLDDLNESISAKEVELEAAKQAEADAEAEAAKQAEAEKEAEKNDLVNREEDLKNNKEEYDKVNKEIEENAKVIEKSEAELKELIELQETTDDWSEREKLNEKIQAAKQALKEAKDNEDALKKNLANLQDKSPVIVDPTMEISLLIKDQSSGLEELIKKQNTVEDYTEREKLDKEIKDKKALVESLNNNYAEALKVEESIKNSKKEVSKIEKEISKLQKDLDELVKKQNTVEDYTEREKLNKQIQDLKEKIKKFEDLKTAEANTQKELKDKLESLKKQSLALVNASTENSETTTSAEETTASSVEDTTATSADETTATSIDETTTTSVDEATATSVEETTATSIEKITAKDKQNTQQKGNLAQTGEKTNIYLSIALIALSCAAVFIRKLVSNKN